MPVTPPHDGRSSRAPDPRLDGRLDLDDLDAALEWRDVVGDDGATLREELLDRLERHGVSPFVRRHRAGVVAVVAATALVLVAGGSWWASRPAPLDDVVHVTVVSGGGGAPGLEATQISQVVLVTSTEPKGVRSDVLDVHGPGLVSGFARIPTGFAGAVTTGAVTAQVRCGDPAQLDAVLAARASDYGVTVRRSSPTGEVRTDDVALATADDWLRTVRGVCVQGAADRALRVTSVDARARTDVVATDLDLAIRNDSSRDWDGLRVADSPEVNTNGPVVDIPASTSRHLLVRLWPSSCSTPVAALSGGLGLSARLSTDTTDRSLEPVFRLALDRAALDTVSAAAAVMCRGPVPTVTVVRARSVSGAQGTSAGTVEVHARVSAPGADVVGIDPVAAGAVGQITAGVTPVRVVDGHADLVLQWTLPQCVDLISAGRPRVHLVVEDTRRRPFSLPLGGSPLRVALTRLCGQLVGDSVA